MHGFVKRSSKELTLIIISGNLRKHEQSYLIVCRGRDTFALLLNFDRT